MKKGKGVSPRLRSPCRAHLKMVRSARSGAAPSRRRGRPISSYAVRVERNTLRQVVRHQEERINKLQEMVREAQNRLGEVSLRLHREAALTSRLHEELTEAHKMLSPHQPEVAQQLLTVLVQNTKLSHEHRKAVAHAESVRSKCNSLRQALHQNQAAADALNACLVSTRDALVQQQQAHARQLEVLQQHVHEARAQVQRADERAANAERRAATAEERAGAAEARAAAAQALIARAEARAQAAEERAEQADGDARAAVAEAHGAQRLVFELEQQLFAAEHAVDLREGELRQARQQLAVLAIARTPPAAAPAAAAVASSSAIGARAPAKGPRAARASSSKARANRAVAASGCDVEYGDKDSGCSGGDGWADGRGWADEDEAAADSKQACTAGCAGWGHGTDYCCETLSSCADLLASPCIDSLGESEWCTLLGVLAAPPPCSKQYPPSPPDAPAQHPLQPLASHAPEAPAPQARPQQYVQPPEPPVPAVPEAPAAALPSPAKGAGSAGGVAALPAGGHAQGPSGAPGSGSGGAPGVGACQAPAGAGLHNHLSFLLLQCGRHTAPPRQLQQQLAAAAEAARGAKSGPSLYSPPAPQLARCHSAPLLHAGGGGSGCNVCDMSDRLDKVAPFFSFACNAQLTGSVC